ncbi:MAG: HAMP domain-containing protein [Proteobacteria bacterium]|nr:HAMP domain-containing protein [Pseudomonadota bacterium]
MGRLINTLRARVIGVVLVIHAVLVPLLYLGVSTIVQEGYIELFVNPIRSYSRLVADELEGAPAENFDQHAAELLDSVSLSGQVLFAEVVDGGRRLHGTVATAPFPDNRSDDFRFGEQGDSVYFISHRVKRPAGSVVLRLGFDEGPTLQRVDTAKRRVLMVMLIFTAVSVAASIWLSAMISRPMVRLRESAEKIALGDVRARIQVRSSISEVRELNHHLEHMRHELVGSNERLVTEMSERAASDAKRLDLERRLLHRERIATIGTLAGGVAHEFNNIMTPILLYSQAALRELPADSRLYRDLTRIVAAAQRARKLVQGILTFSREMDAKRAAVFSVRPTIEEALDLLRAIVPANIEIAFQFRGDQDLVVFGDPSLLHQVVINLCTNSYQAMRPNAGRLSLTLAPVQEPPEGAARHQGGYALLEVSDTGHGMEPAVLAHIFDPFFTTRDVGEGTGLGLSVVHGIVTSMEGMITVDSTVGVGTRVRIYLPAAV